MGNPSLVVCPMLESAKRLVSRMGPSRRAHCKKTRVCFSCAQKTVFLCRPFQRAARVPLSTEQMTPSKQNKSHTIFDDLLLSKSTLHKACKDLLTLRSTIFCVE